MTFIFTGVLLSQEAETFSMEAFKESEETEDLFQIAFFESLKQKGIENYQFAINSLEEAEKYATSNDKKAVVKFEKGKNYFLLKDYSKAEENYVQSLSLAGDRPDVLERMFDLYHAQSNYEKAIPVVQKLIGFDENYKEDLANLYAHTEQFDKALELLNELEKSWGESPLRNALKARVYKASGNTSGAIEELEQRIQTNPKNEQEHLNLIFLYSEQGENEKAFEAAKELLVAHPESRLVHLALYKYYLEDNQAKEAVQSMHMVFKATEIDKETKYKVLSDFLQFVEKNPEYSDDLHKAIDLFPEKNAGIYEQLGGFYLSRNEKETALNFFERGLRENPENYNLIKNSVLLQIDVGRFEDAGKLSETALEVYPVQALLYLLNGVANNHLGKFPKAIESLETGLDFVFDDPKMEKDFYEQLSFAYEKNGNPEKARRFSEQAKKIQITQ